MLKRKVLHVVYSLDPGGMENGVVNIANSLDSNEFEIGILCLSHRGELADRLHSQVKVYELGKKNGLDLTLFIRIYKFIADLRPDIVHSHNLGPLIYASLPIVAISLKIQLVHGEHASLTATDLSYKKVIQRIILYSNCSVIHTVGHEMTKHFMEIPYFSNPVYTFQNGVDTTKYSPGSDDSESRIAVSYGIKDKIVISVFARFGKYKGHVDLLHVFEHVAPKQHNVVLMFVGGGGECEEQILSLVKTHKFGDRIICTGFQQNPVPFYKASDFVLLASKNEGLSNVMLEAMSCSKTVAALGSCGVSDLIVHGQNGYHILDSSIEGIAIAIISLLEKPKQNLRDVGCNAREYILSNYSIDAMIQNYYSCYLAFGVQERV